MNLDHLKNKIAIVGVGYTPQGKVPGRTAISFHCEAVANAIADAGIGKNEIDALYAYRHFDALAGDFDLTGYALAAILVVNAVAGMALDILDFVLHCKLPLSRICETLRSFIICCKILFIRF